jgi:hypothetical protein
MPGDNILGRCLGPYESKISSVTVSLVASASYHGEDVCSGNEINEAAEAEASWEKAASGVSPVNGQFHAEEYCCGTCSVFSFVSDFGDPAPAHGSNKIDIDSPDPDPPCGPSSSDEFPAWLTVEIAGTTNEDGRCVYTIRVRCRTTGVVDVLELYSADVTANEVVGTHHLSDSGTLDGGEAYAISATVTIA